MRRCEDVTHLSRHPTPSSLIRISLILIPLLVFPLIRIPRVQRKSRAKVDNTSVEVAYAGGRVSIKRPLSIRAVNAIKSDGTYYFEIAIHGDGTRRRGTSLQVGKGLEAALLGVWSMLWV